MSNNRALAVKGESSLLRAWQTIQSIAPVAASPRIFGATQEEIAIKMLVAWEHGIPLTSALSTVYIINNMPSLAPKLVWGKVVAHHDFDSYAEKRLEKDGAFYGWEIMLKRKNGVQATRRFTLDDAKRITVKPGQQLIDKDNWQNYPEQMCYWRTMGFVIDAVFPDVAQGLHRPEELGATVDAEGVPVIEGQYEVVEPAPVIARPVATPPTIPPPPLPVHSTPVAAPPVPEVSPAPLEPVKSELTIADLLALGYNPAQIMAASDNRLPSTSEQCEAVKAKLEADSE